MISNFFCSAHFYLRVAKFSLKTPMQKVQDIRRQTKLTVKTSLLLAWTYYLYEIYCMKERSKYSLMPLVLHCLKTINKRKKFKV